MSRRVEAVSHGGGSGDEPDSSCPVIVRWYSRQLTGGIGLSIGIEQIISSGGNHVGLIADIQKLSADSIQTATDAAAVTDAQSALAAAQAQVDQDSQTATADDAQLVTDLSAPPYNGQCWVPDPNNQGYALVYKVDPNSPVGYTVTSVPPAS